MKNLCSYFTRTFVLAGLFFLSGCHQPQTTPSLTLPSAQQLDFMDREIGAFFHFTTNTFTKAEHGDGSATPQDFNPTDLDIETWMQAAENIGAKYAVLTVRHEDGFCLWPTKTTEYCVRNSPWKNGKGDLAREFVEACHRHNIKPGFYFSPNYNGSEIFRPEDRPVAWGKEWGEAAERHLADPGVTEHFRQLEIDQITELMSNYGPIYYIWMDHWSDAANCPAVTETIRQLQPNCLCCGPDIRTPGNEKGVVLYPFWNPVFTKDSTNRTRAAQHAEESNTPNEYGLLETSRITGNSKGLFWRNVECPTADMFDHGGWFWHGALKALSPEERMENYYRTVGVGANLIVNLPPDTRGQIPQETLVATKEWGDAVRKRFGGPYVADRTTLPKGDTIEMRWNAPCRIDHVMLMEDLTQGQKVGAYELEVHTDGKWQPAVAANKFSYCPKEYNLTPGFETIGHKKIDRIVAVVADGIRFRCTKKAATPVTMRRMAVWAAE